MSSSTTTGSLSFTPGNASITAQVSREAANDTIQEISFSFQESASEVGPAIIEINFNGGGGTGLAFAAFTGGVEGSITTPVTKDPFPQGQTSSLIISISGSDLVNVFIGGVLYSAFTVPGIDACGFVTFTVNPTGSGAFIYSIADFATNATVTSYVLGFLGFKFDNLWLDIDLQQS